MKFVCSYIGTLDKAVCQTVTLLKSLSNSNVDNDGAEPNVAKSVFLLNSYATLIMMSSAHG